MAENRGQRIARELREPDSFHYNLHETGILIFRTLYEEGPLAEEGLSKKLICLQKGMQKKNPEFFLAFGKYDLCNGRNPTLENELLRLHELGFVDVPRWDGSQPIYRITRKGVEELKEDSLYSLRK